MMALVLLLQGGRGCTFGVHFGGGSVFIRAPLISPVCPVSVIPSIKNHFQRLGYRPELVAERVELWNGQGTAALVAHSRLPRDIRTAAIAVVEETDGSSAGEMDVRATGAALVFSLRGQEWRCSRVGIDSLAPIGRGTTQELGKFIERHTNDFNPDAIYRAKAWGRIDPTQRQLEFVDSGLLPLMEAELGHAVSRLLEECVQELAHQLGWESLEDSSSGRRKAEWLVQAPFWLLAAKTLQDKNVERFRRLDLQDFDTVFSRLCRHYKSDDSQPLHVPKNRQRALIAVAAKIERFASLELLSAEALGHVYESTLINKATRKLLGTHSTPPWLIDYILGKLRPWIAAMPVEDRRVFEPACGHAGFLVGALRLLDELRPDTFLEPRVSYLRKRLHGVDIDPFSQEVARLALTLADVPNPNGWNLDIQDIFPSDIVERGTQAANIVLANPPFENFRGDGRAEWLVNKAAETLSRIVHNLPVGGVLGFVGPQGLLQSKQSSGLRKRMLAEYEISEVTLFADEVFQYGEPESTVIIARRLAKSERHTPRIIKFNRVREGEIGKFSATLESDAVENCKAEELLKKDDCPLFVPDLAEVWQYFKELSHPPLSAWADAGQGFVHKGAASIPESFSSRLESDEVFDGGVAGFANWDHTQLTHELPETKFLNLDPYVIRRPQWGIAKDIPQLLLNYARVSRGPWRLKCLLDVSGHPVTSRFVVVRPKQVDIPLAALWAILNSPLANAFAFSWLSKRDNIVGVLREMPMPVLGKRGLAALGAMASSYLKAANAWSAAQTVSGSALPLFDSIDKPTHGYTPTAEELRILHLRLDAAVMEAYGLPSNLEKKVLDLFDRGEGHPRKGVPFHQCGYFPKSFTQLSTAAEFLAVVDWDATYADRKTNLIEKKVQKTATKEELDELMELKRLSAARRDLLAPLPLAHALALHNELSLEIRRHP